MATAPPIIPDLPATPDRADRSTFNARAVALFDTIKATWQAALQLAAQRTYDNALEAATSASTATAKAAEATTAAAAAVTVSGAVAWVSGTTYAKGACVWSPTNLQTYRRAVAGAGTTDPSLDAVNWAPIGGTSLAQLQATALCF